MNLTLRGYMCGYPGVDLAGRRVVALSSRAQRVWAGRELDSWVGAPKRRDPHHGD